MSEEQFYEKIKNSVDVLPGLPATVTKVLELCNNSQTNPIDLYKVISLDPVLMGKVLKLINTAFYGYNNHITSPARAIIILGMNTVKNVVLSTAILRNLDSRKRSYLDMDGFWRHSLCVGGAAKLLAKKRGIDKKKQDDYFFIGLLHDIGKILLDTALNEDYESAIKTAEKERNPLFAVENRLFKINHCQAGKMIADLWNLDGALRDAMIYHHTCGDYTGNYKDELFTIVAANRFANLSIGSPCGGYSETPDDAVFRFLDIPQDVFCGIKGDILAEIAKAKVFLNLR